MIQYASTVEKTEDHTYVYCFYYFAVIDQQMQVIHFFTWKMKTTFIL